MILINVFTSVCVILSTAVEGGGGQAWQRGACAVKGLEGVVGAMHLQGVCVVGRV